MGVLDRWRRHHDGDDTAAALVVDPDAAVRQYHVALRSASPALLTAVHGEALEHLASADLVELRRRLDARLSHPNAPGDASIDAVAGDLAQLASTGSGAVVTLLAEPGRDGSDGSHRVDEERLAVAFVSSHVWRVVSGRIRPSRHGSGPDEAKTMAQAEALAFAELHKFRNNAGGIGYGFGPQG